jgi:hypothetical protein
MARCVWAVRLSVHVLAANTRHLLAHIGMQRIYWLRYGLVVAGAGEPRHGHNHPLILSVCVGLGLVGGVAGCRVGLTSMD